MKTKVCCLKQSAGVPRVEYTPSYVECDFTSSDANQCIARAESKLISAVESDLTRGAQRYKKWKRKCVKYTGRIPKLRKVMKGHQGKCTKFKVTAEITAKQVNRDKPTLLGDWAREKNKYNREYSKKRAYYRKAYKRIKREERIRFQEWDSTQEIKCMLRSYEKCKRGSSNCSGQLNRASMKRCTNKVKTQPKRKSLTIHYPKLLQRLQWRLGDFAGLVDTSGFSKHCNRTEKADELADAPKRCRRGKNFHKQKPKPVCKVGGKKVKLAKVTPAKKNVGKISKKIRVSSPSPARRRRRTKVSQRRRRRTKVNRCRASTSNADPGYSDQYRGWYDASGCGRCYDYCRWVGNTRNPRQNPATRTQYGVSWWSCRKAGGSSPYTGKGAYGSRFKFRKCNGKGGTPLPAQRRRRSWRRPQRRRRSFNWGRWRWGE